jgi:hypothetical protein
VGNDAADDRAARNLLGRKASESAGGLGAAWSSLGSSTRKDKADENCRSDVEALLIQLKL